VAIATKSDLILRDIDLLREIAAQAPVLCKVTITTCDDSLAAKLEPRAASSSRRFETVAALREQGLFAGILLMPVLPFLEDGEENILGIVHRAKESGANFIYPALGVTLRGSQRLWFLQQLELLFPGEGLAARYQRRYGESYECRIPHLRERWNAFSAACDQAGILYQMRDIVRAFRRGYETPQTSLFKRKSAPCLKAEDASFLFYRKHITNGQHASRTVNLISNQRSQSRISDRVVLVGGRDPAPATPTGPRALRRNALEQRRGRYHQRVIAHRSEKPPVACGRQSACGR
jgi:hypothetical protein